MKLRKTEHQKTAVSEKIISTVFFSSDLKERSIRGGISTFASQGAKLILNIGSTIILARLLTPKDFGLIAMVTATTGFIMIFKDLGLSVATVQRTDINQSQLSTLFWINIAMSTFLALLTFSLAPVVAWFYSEPKLTVITYAFSITFILSGLTAQHQAILLRKMRLTTVAVIDVFSMLSGITVGIICSLTGFGYWSLVWMPIVTGAMNAVCIWIVSGWLPGKPVRNSGLRSLLTFGGYLTGFGFVNYFARNLDNILIGRYCGTQQLGLYSKAYSLLLLPIGQIVSPMTSVAIPVLSRLQNDPERYRLYYLTALKILSYFSMPLIVFLGVLSSDIIVLILGKQWLGAAKIFNILAMAAFFQPIVSTVGWIYVSLGKTRRLAAWGIISSILIIASFLIGLKWGAIGVATSYAIVSVILVYPTFAVALAGSPLSFNDIYQTISPPFYISVAVGSAMFVSRNLMDTADVIWPIINCMIIGMIVAGLWLVVFPKARKDILGIFSIITSYFKGNGTV